MPSHLEKAIGCTTQEYELEGGLTSHATNWWAVQPILSQQQRNRLHSLDGSAKLYVVFDISAQRLLKFEIGNLEVFDCHNGIAFSCSCNDVKDLKKIQVRLSGSCEALFTTTENPFNRLLSATGYTQKTSLAGHDRITYRFKAKQAVAGNCSRKIADHRLTASPSDASFARPDKGRSACLRLRYKSELILPV